MAAIDQNVAGDTIDLRVLRLLKTVEGRKDPPKSIETTIKLRLA